MKNYDDAASEHNETSLVGDSAAAASASPVDEAVKTISPEDTPDETVGSAVAEESVTSANVTSEDVSSSPTSADEALPQPNSELEMLTKAIWQEERYIVEYALEIGFLKLSPQTRAKLNIRFADFVGLGGILVLCKIHEESIFLYPIFRFPLMNKKYLTKNKFLS